ncbi:hypothetical protein Glove_87g112 [Diversispora epigaea]|uniref:Uncharacterized protein n=1 Tax=Diversispora epigaea TaxID=1348612 RepID=A0A397J609_9GLOM|nr:hypothetical protein Glove_87g115 [Diversispora epigaea]RHZ83756.1 hypothetical protein Glove_87g112 [Diversispora epigaea]
MSFKCFGKLSQNFLMKKNTKVDEEGNKRFYTAHSFISTKTKEECVWTNHNHSRINNYEWTTKKQKNCLKLRNKMNTKIVRLGTLPNALNNTTDNCSILNKRGDEVLTRAIDLCEEKNQYRWTNPTIQCGQ